MEGPNKGNRAVYVVRHGEKERADGLDPPLTPLGVQQAEATGKYLKDCKIALMVVSPFRRTLQTAVQICKNLRPEKVVIDWGVGEWLEAANWGEGPCPAIDDLETNHAEREDLMAELKIATHTMYTDQPCPAESRDQLHTRTAAALNHLNSALPKGNILIITHAATHEALVRAMCTGHKPFFPDPCSLSIVIELAEKGAWMVEQCASTQHLAYLAKQQGPVHRGPQQRR